MGVRRSIKITRRKAIELVAKAMGDEAMLKTLVNAILDERTDFYNCYAICADDDPENEDRHIDHI